MRFVLLAIAVGFLPCKKAAPGADASTDGGTAMMDGGKSPQLSAEETEMRALSAKMEPYVEIANEFTSDTKKNRRGYLDDVHSVDPKTGPKAKPWGKIYLRDMKDPQPFITKMNAAKPKKPSLPDLETAGDQYAAALNALKPLLHEAAPYYDAENNKDDKGKKGRELHPKLLAAWADFDKASTALGDALDKYEDDVTNKKLAILAKEPQKRFSMLHTKILYDAKAVVKLAGDCKEPKDLPLDKFSAKDDALEKTFADLKAYKDEKKPPGKDPAADQRRDTNTSSLISAAEPFVKSAKALLRRKRDNEKYSSGDKMLVENGSSEMVDGAPGQVVKKYNELIDASNRM